MDQEAEDMELHLNKSFMFLLLNQCFIKFQQLPGQFLFRLLLMVVEDMAAEAKEVTVVVVKALP